MLEDRRGALWIGSSAGLDRWIPAADRFTAPQVTRFRRGDESGFEAESVAAILEDRRGTIWVATIGGGLIAFSAEEAARPQPRFVSHQPNRDDPTSIASDAVLSLMEDSSGNLWVGTYRGLHRVLNPASLPSSFKRYQHDRENPRTLSADSVEAIAEDTNGMLWVGTYSGLNRFDPRTAAVTRYMPDARRRGSMTHEFIYDIHVDRKGRVWIATWGGGLCLFEPGSQTFRNWGTREGLPGETIRDVAEGGDGAIWLATTRGLASLNVESDRIGVLTVRDGLHTDDLFSLAWSGDGRLLAGGAGGLTSFDPQSLIIDRDPPPVVLTGFRLLNERVPIGGESVLSESITLLSKLVLRHHDYLFAIDFAALTFSRPEKARYAYRLENLHGEWISVDATGRRAVFSNVPPGDYVFRVRAANADGVWNERGATVALSVLPPWWQTWWARSAALLLLIAAAAAIPLIRLKRQRAISAMLELKVAERTADLEEANRQLDAASRTDPLTQLPNRRHFTESAEEQLTIHRRYGRPFCIALCDVDHFKSVNDTWGHDAGDAVLKTVASVLRRSVRESDLVARWGGEEFIVLLPECSVGDAARVAEIMRRSIADTPVDLGETVIRVSMTIGVSEAAEGMTLDRLAARADAALYEGKRSGRNRVVLAA
jgi:diguanylate cyclase (GGDEF)-like protein